MRVTRRRVSVRGQQRGAAAVEFALVLPLLLVLLVGIIDFGLYLYNDLQLTHAARDAARYLSVDNAAMASQTISEATLTGNAHITSSPPAAVTVDHGEQFTLTVEGTYDFITPLPLLVGISDTKAIHATVVMRRE